MIIDPGPNMGRATGIWLLGIGAFFLLGFGHFFNLYFEQVWPLVIIAFGAALIWRALDNKPRWGGR
jgi:hypothetical protein